MPAIIRHRQKSAGQAVPLAGMPVEKFTQAIADIQSGKSGKNRKMITVAKQLSADDVANLAAYYASLKK